MRPLQRNIKFIINNHNGDFGTRKVIIFLCYFLAKRFEHNFCWQHLYKIKSMIIHSLPK